MASSTPRFVDISNVPVILYFLFLPGFAITLLMRESYNLLERLSFSVILSLGAVLTLWAVETNDLPVEFSSAF